MFDKSRLIQLRIQKGVSQHELALCVSIDRTTIMRIEDGKLKNPSFHIVSKLSDYFKVNMETFKKGTLL